MCEVHKEGPRVGRAHCVDPCHSKPCKGGQVCSVEMKAGSKMQTCKPPCDGFHCNKNEVKKVSSYRDKTWTYECHEGGMKTTISGFCVPL